MHADRLVKKRKTQHAQLHAREPALINLPIPIPSNIPILSPIINPLVAGIPSSAFPLPIQSWPPLISLPGHTTQTTAQVPTQTPAAPTPTSASVPTATPQQPATGSTSPSGDGSGNSQSPSDSGSGGSVGGGQAAGGSSSSNASPSGISSPQPSASGASSGVNASGSSDVTSGRTFADGSPVPTQNAAVNVGSDPSSGSGSGAGQISAGVSASVTYTGAGSHSTGASGSAGGGTSSGGNGTGSGDDPTTSGTGAVEDGSHKSFPTAAIIALAVIGALGLLALIVFCCRRSAKARRIARRKLWFGGEKRVSIYGAVSSSGYFRENDVKSVRSSFGTSFEQHTDPFRLSHQPPIPLGSDWPLYNPQTAQVAEAPPISIPSPVAIVCKPPSPTVRAESRPNSMGSDISNPFDDTAHPGQVLLVPERSAMSPELPATPLSVRPFSPSERWSFPMPPSSRHASSQFPSRTTSASPATFDTPYPSEYATAQDSENPFADFESSDAGHTSETYVTADTDAAAHFLRIESVCRPFDPTRSDEICVDQGDRVRVLKQFDDGWAYADNCTSGQRGLFPIDCLRMPNQELPDFLSAKRLSSYTSSSSTQLSVVKEAGLV